MPKYEVLDTQTDKKYLFEGETPPTQEDVDSYLSQFREKPITPQLPLERISPATAQTFQRAPVPLAQRAEDVTLRPWQKDILRPITPYPEAVIAGFKTTMEGWRRITETVKAPLFEYQKAVREGKPALDPTVRAIPEALKGLRYTPGIAIVKGMGVPLDDPKWVKENPGKHFAAQMLGAWYETYGTDPVIMGVWAKSVPYARKAHLFSQIVKESGKKFTPAILERATIPLSKGLKKEASKLADLLSKGFWGRQVTIGHGLKKIPEATLRGVLKAVRNVKYVAKPKLPSPVGVEPIARPPVAVKPPVRPPVAPVKPPIVKPPVEMVTPTQKIQAHTIARKIKLITTTKTGKLSLNRYRRLAQGITGKRSIKDMTREEADDFIMAMETVVQRRPWEPPIIPMSTKIIPKEFFDIKFVEPGPAAELTPKKYYQRLMGTEPLLRDTISAFEMKALELRDINQWIGNVIKKINKGVSVKEKIAARVLNQPTAPIAKMRDLLDQYEVAPDFLDEKEAEIFTEVRSFTKSLLQRHNEMAARVGLEPIKEVKAYITHWLDEVAKQIIQKKYPFPEDVKYWTGKNLPTKIHNPLELERRVKGDMEKFFSKDLGKLLGAMAKYELRDIYLSEPYSILRAHLNALGDKIPSSVRKEIDSFLRYDIFNYPTELDTMLNRVLEAPTQIINNFLLPYNRAITNPVGMLSRATRRLVIGATIWGRPRLVARNLLTQKLLTMNLYPIRFYLKAQFWRDNPGMMEEIRNTSFYRLSRRHEDIPEGILKAEYFGMLPYQKSHAGINYLSNVDVATKVGWYYGNYMYQQSQNPASRFYKHAQKIAKRDGVPVEKYLWTKEDILLEAVEAGENTQWLYFITNMPKVFRGQTKRAFFTLQSWWMNFFFKHYREALRRTTTGFTTRGKLIRPIDRINWLKGLIVILGVTEGVRQATGLDYQRFLFLWGPLPAYLSPPGQVVMGMYQLMVARTDWEKKKAVRIIKKSYRAFIPGSLAWRDISRYMKGETTLKEFLFHTERKQKKRVLRPPTMPQAPRFPPLRR